jgi:hypothetical protein
VRQSDQPVEQVQRCPKMKLADPRVVEEIVRIPIPEAEINQLKAVIGVNTRGRKAFIFGHGLWSDLDLQKTVD